MTTTEQPQMRRASILMLCFNKVELTKKCLVALRKNTPESLYELILVDNASTDGTREFISQIEKEWGNVRVLIHQENLGFVGGNNAGARLATTENLIFLNNDTEPQPGWLEALLQTLEADSRAGAVGAKLVYPNGRLQEAGGIIFSDASGWNYGRGQDPKDPKFNFVREVDYCSGACLLVRRHLWDTLGGFDTRFAPAYYEDTDLCFSVRQAGWRVLYQPASVIIHHEGGTAGTNMQTGFKRYQVINHEKFREKWQTALKLQAPPGPANVPVASDRRTGKRILFVDALMPMYDKAAGSQRTWEMLRLLAAAGHKVTFIARNGAESERYAPPLQQMGVEIYAGDPDRMRQLGLRCDAWRFDMQTLLTERAFHKALLSFWYIAEQYLPQLNTLSPRTMTYVDTVDVHYVRELRQAELEQNEQLMAAAKERKVRELRTYGQADVLITVTPTDAEALRQELPSVTTKIIPLIHSVSSDSPPFNERKGILFVGNFGHLPNADAVQFFHQQVWPRLRAKQPELELTIVGNKPPPSIQALAGDGITVTGYVPETAPYLRSHRVSIAPLRYGAGMKGKIGEALASGLPVVTTRIGAEGMSSQENMPFMVEDSPEAFAEAVLKLYTEEATWAEYSRRGRAHIDTNFSPKLIGQRLDELAHQPALVSIIVLARNGLADTRLCLESVRQHTSVPYELILVDNGSTDGTVSFFRQYSAQHPHVRVVLNRTNRGFAGGNNQGLTLARGDYAVLLNNDTVVTAGWLEDMLRVFQQYPEVGIVGPRSNYVAGAQLVRDPGYRTLEELPDFAAQWRKAHAGQSVELSRVIGFCLMASRAVLEQIGGLDEAFINGNFEDDDFCLRAGCAGFHVRMAQAVFIHHTGSRTFQNMGLDYKKHMLANWEVFKAKWGIPKEAPAEQGYRLPLRRADGQPLHFSFRESLATCRPGGMGIIWTDTNRRPVSTPAPVQLPACALLGGLRGALKKIEHGQFSEAWTETLAAIQVRPYHPEGFLLLAQIALAAGDSAAARRCAEHAQTLAPSWKSAKKFLKGNLYGNNKPAWLVLPEEVQSPNSKVQSPGSAGHSSQGGSSSRLTVCVIARNEEKFLPQCLKSVQGIARQVIVVDTGSTDRTVEIAKEHGAEVHHFTWCDDFSAARNVALEHARGDWILMLDADEELAAEQRPRLEADMKCKRVIAHRLPLVNRDKEAEGYIFVPRLFRNVPGTFYQGRIHEQVFASFLPCAEAWGLGTQLGSAQLLHHGYAKDVVKDRNKVERNLRLLRQAVEENPDNANLTMNLGLELVHSGEFEAGLEQYREAFRIMGAQPPAQVVPELREALLTQLSCALCQVRAFDEVVELLTSPLARTGGLTASHHFALGLAYLALKRFREAAEQMRQCFAKMSQRTLSPVNTDIFTAAPYHCLAMSLAKTDDATGAEKAFQEGLAKTGRTQELKVDYAKFMAEQERPVEALQQLHEIVAENSQNAQAWHLGGQIALSQPEFLEFARDWTGEAVQYLPEDNAVRALRAEALMLSGDTAAARKLWELVWNETRNPAVLAALLLCETEQGEVVHAPENPADAPAVTRAFFDFYRKCLAAGGRETIARLNAHAEQLRLALPEAARLLEAIAAEMRQAESKEQSAALEPCAT